MKFDKQHPSATWVEHPGVGQQTSRRVAIDRVQDYCRIKMEGYVN